MTEIKQNPHLIRNLLQETIHMNITVETIDNKIHFGTIKEIDDYMNIFMKDDGREVFIRGSTVRFIRLPDILKYSPLLKSIKSNLSGVE